MNPVVLSLTALLNISEALRTYYYCTTQTTYFSTFLQLNKPLWRNNENSTVFCRNQVHHAHHDFPAQPNVPMSRHYVSTVTSRHHRECPTYPTDSGSTSCNGSLPGGHLRILREVGTPAHLETSSETARKLHPEQLEYLLNKQPNTVYSGRSRTERVPLLLGQAHRGGTSINSKQYKS